MSELESTGLDSHISQGIDRSVVGTKNNLARQDGCAEIVGCKLLPMYQLTSAELNIYKSMSMVNSRSPIIIKQPSFVNFRLSLYGEVLK